MVADCCIAALGSDFECTNQLQREVPVVDWCSAGCGCGPQAIGCTLQANGYRQSTVGYRLLLPGDHAADQGSPPGDQELETLGYPCVRKYKTTISWYLGIKQWELWYPQFRANLLPAGVIL